MKRNMKSKRSNRGFTMVEMLATLAMLSILATLSFVGVMHYQKIMKQTELDGTAKELFIAAQNHLSYAKADGGLTPETLAGIASTVAGEDHVYYYVVNAGMSAQPSGSLATANNASQLGTLYQMLPFGAIDETVRVGNSSKYVIKYNYETATVLEVFYTNEDGVSFGGTAVDCQTLHDDYADTSDASRSSKRRDYNETGKVIGWYDGRDLDLESAETIETAPTIWMENSERLAAYVKNPLTSADVSAKVSLRLVVTGKLSGAHKAIDLVNNGQSVTQTRALGDATVYVRKFDASGPDRPYAAKYGQLGAGDFVIVFDDITEPNQKFAEQFKNPTGSTSPAFIPGEDLDVQVVAFNNTRYSNIVKSASITENSLFSSIYDKKVSTTNASDETIVTYTPTARVSSIRHLENLDESVSRYNPASLIEPDTLNNVGAYDAEQVRDLSWVDFCAVLDGHLTRALAEELGVQQNEGDKAFVTQGLSKFHIYKYNDGSTPTGTASAAGTMFPVNPSFNLAYDGASYVVDENGNAQVSSINRIENVAVKVSGPAGVFGSVEGGVLKNLVIVDANITSENDEAGALAGMLTDTSVSGVLAYNEGKDESSTAVDDDSSLQVQGKTNVGGLVGSASGGSIDQAAAAVYVKSTGTAGGLVGTATSTEINQSYAAGHTVESAYNDATTGAGRINVQGSTAGGLVGKADNGSGVVSITDSYTTCSVAGNNADKVDAFVADGAPYTENCYAVGPTYVIASTSDEKGSLSSEGVSYWDGDGDLSTNIEDILVAEDNRQPAAPYDGTLASAYAGKYTFKTVAQLAGLTDSDEPSFFVQWHYGDWAVPEDEERVITIEDVNKENNFLIITDSNANKVKSEDFGSDGAIVLEYATVDTSGRNLVYRRELHPERDGDWRPDGFSVNANNSGKTSANEAIGFETGQFCKSFTYSDDETGKTARKYYVLIDSITTEVANGQGGHAVNRFPGISPGANITVTAYVRNGNELVEQAHITTNSLFDSIMASNATSFSAQLKNGRHLQNLDYRVSGLNNKATTPKIAGIDLRADIMWENVYVDAVSDEYETFYDENGNQLHSFFDGATNCIDNRLYSDGAPDDFYDAFGDWEDPYVHMRLATAECNSLPQASPSNPGSTWHPYKQEEFVPITLLHAMTTNGKNIQNFVVDGHKHRLINFTMGGYQTTKNGAVGEARNDNDFGNYLGLFSRCDSGTLSFTDMYMVNPNSGFFKNPSHTGPEYNTANDDQAGTFISRTNLTQTTFLRCGVYMSSASQYYMGTANLEDPVNLNPSNVDAYDPKSGMNDGGTGRGRRMFSKTSSSGGFVGRAQGNVTIRESFASVPVFSGINGNSNAGSSGGMIGWVSSDCKQLVIEDSYVSGFLQESADKSDAESSTYTYSATSIGISGFTTSGTAGVGGIVGVLDSGSKATITNCYSTAAVAGNKNIGGFIGSFGRNSADRINACYSLGAVYGRSEGAAMGLFAAVNNGNESELQQVFTNCFAFGAVNDEFTEVTAEYSHPMSSLSRKQGANGDDSTIVPFHYTKTSETDTTPIISMEYLKQDRASHNGTLNRTFTTAYNSPHTNYLYRAVNNSRPKVLSPTGASTASNAKYTHVGDWPAIAYRVEIQDVNEENHYIVVTDKNYQADGDDPAYKAEGLVVLRYETIDTEGNPLVFERELHPAWAANKKLNDGSGTQVLANKSGRQVDGGDILGFETGQFCKAGDPYYDAATHKWVRQYYVLIDSITAKFEQNQSGHATAGDFGRFVGMAPGANIKITAYVRANGLLAEQTSIETNSLFDFIDQTQDQSGTNKYTAHIANGRHLQNLTPRMALLDNTNNALKVSRVSIDNDIAWDADVVTVNKSGGTYYETFYDANGNRIVPFWEAYTTCLPEDMLGAMSNWTQDTLAVSLKSGSTADTGGKPIHQDSFAPIQLLDISSGDTGVDNFEVAGNDKRLINFTMGGRVSDKDQWKAGSSTTWNYGAIGLFATPAGYGGEFTVHPEVILNIHDLYMVNPNIDLERVKGKTDLLEKADIGTGAFAGEPYCTLNMENCGVYMSSADQYWMGSAEMEDEDNWREGSTFTQNVGKCNVNGRRILSNGGSVGGLIGRMHGNADIHDCFATVPVYGGVRVSQDGASAGGLIGMIRGNNVAKYYTGRKVVISDCYAGGYLANDVDGDSSAYVYSADSVGVAEFSTNDYAGAGGFIGAIQWGKDLQITNCYSAASVAGAKNVGGFFGYTAGNTNYKKGLNDEGVRLRNCYSLGSVYTFKNLTKNESGMFCFVMNNKVSEALMKTSFDHCYAFGASNMDTVFNVPPEHYRHPLTSCGANRGSKYKDDSEIIPYHYTKVDDEDTVINTDYLIEQRGTGAAPTATMGYSIALEDYPYNAVTNAGYKVIANTGPTMPSASTTVYVGDWPFISTASDVRVTLDNEEKLMAQFAIPKDQLLLGTPISVLVRGKASEKGALLRFTMKAGEEAYEFAMDDPGDSDVDAIKPIGKTEQERTAWIKNAQVTCAEDETGDNVVLSFAIDDPFNEDAEIAAAFDQLFNGIGMLPGEEIAVAVEIGEEPASELVTYVDNPAYEKAGRVAKTNSLFGDATLTDGESEGAYNATIKAGAYRHLQNLGAVSSSITVTKITQTANIEVDEDLQPINAAKLTEYDGGSFTISGIDIESSDTAVGLFSNVCAEDAFAVKNLTLKGSMKTTAETGYVGAVAGAVGKDDETRELTLTNVDATGVTISGSQVWPDPDKWPKHQSQEYADAKAKFEQSIGRVLGESYVTIDGFDIIEKGEPAIETAVLQKEIADAKADLAKHEKSAEAQAELQGAIDIATGVSEKANVTQAEIDKAVDDLRAALAAYDGAVSTQSADNKSKSSESKSKSSASTDSDASKGSSGSGSDESSSSKSASTDSADASGASEQSVETQSTDTSSNEPSADEPSGEAMSTQSADTPGDENAPNADKE